MKTILTGIRTNGELTLGNFLGAMLPMVRLANAHSKDHHVNIFVPDLHTIIADIDARTDERILSGYEWTVLHGDEDGSHIGETVNVWLTMENQNNFKEAHRIAGNNASLVIPVKFKISEDAEKHAIYETFNSFEELNAFYLGAFAYVKACLDAGWQKKDAFDRTPYEEVLGNSDIQSVSEV